MSVTQNPARDEINIFELEASSLFDFSSSKALCVRVKVITVAFFDESAASLRLKF